jgi:hypothetical protein
MHGAVICSSAYRLVVAESRDLFVAMPEFHIVAVDKLLGAHFRIVVVIANKIEALPDMAIRFE